MKPFRPPTLIRPQAVSLSRPSPDEPAVKKRRLDRENASVVPHTDPLDTKIASSAPRLPSSSVERPAARVALADIGIPSNLSPLPRNNSLTSDVHYSVLWRKFTTKKNKTWDGDGTLIVSEDGATLKDDAGKLLGRGSCDRSLDTGSLLSIAGREIEIQAIVSTMESKVKIQPGFEISAAKSGRNEISNVSTSLQGRTAPRSALAHPASRQIPKLSAFKTPLLNNTVQTLKTSARLPTPRHDPNAPGALVMKRPKRAPINKQIVDVVVDPILTAKLHEHQRAGVAFLYDCVMGMNNSGGEGAILADEMGLGKTLQTITLLWTLLKQNPIHDQSPVVKKALIVCPVTLVNNWRKEFRKWLGKESIGVLVADDKHTRLSDFTLGKAYSVMIIGYEKLRTVQADLQKGSGIDIVIADEGHRLKTAQNKSAQAIKSLNTERRIILSGTPLQNDLAEFYTMVDFVNPGLLNKYSAFKRDFEAPILRSQQPGASENDIEKGEARSRELANVTSQFILRRTADILLNYLPPKTEYVVFCRPTEVQASVYRAILSSPVYGAALGSPSLSLELINILKKVCNSPNLLLSKGEESAKTELLDCIPQKLLKFPGVSGKLQVLDSLLHTIRHTTDEKVVLVSNYTSTLDILANLLASLSYKYLRLDGSTPPKKRQDLVDVFNRAPASHSFVFLLSAKAGGMGLNLIGASRLILFDLDWNPATDLQAMARVHRHGQKRPCIIYRLVTQGALDEKIFQRQVSKTGLADSIVDGKNGASGFTREELRDIFSFDEADTCQTHKLLMCNCGGNGRVVAPGLEEDDQIDRCDGIVDEEQSPRPRCDFIKSSQRHWQAEEEATAQQNRDSSGRRKMLSLMKYAHYDPARRKDTANVDNQSSGIIDPDALDAIIEDQALRKLIEEEAEKIGYVFIKPSGL